MTPVDGSFDASAETASLTIPIGALAPGQHIVYFTGTDAGGSTGVPTAVLFTIAIDDVLLQNGFESS